MRLGLVGVMVALGCLAGAQSAAAVPADTTITEGVANGTFTRDNTPTFAFTASQTNVTFTCTIITEQASTNTPCTSPFTLPPQTDGAHGFAVTATNSVAETDPSPARRDFVVDTTPPETTITSGPAEGEVVNTDAPAFTWASSEQNSTFACITDGTALSSCDLTFVAGASAGRHTFSVAATDAAGNTDPTPATRSFSVSLTGAPPAIAHCQYDGNVIAGTSGPDTRAGTAGTDLMFGLGGNDILRGAGGQDCLSGGAGNDRLSGDAGLDFISGGSGNDSLTGGLGNDELRAGAGHDRVTGSAGLDLLVGDAGNDRLTDTRGRDSFSGGAGNDRINSRDNTPFGRRASDVVRCGAGRFDIATVDRGDRVNRDCERVIRR